MERVTCTISEPTAARRRLFFIAIDNADGKTPLTAADMGAFTVKTGLDGAAFGAPTGGAPVQVDAANAPGLFYWPADVADLAARGKLFTRITAAAGGGGKVMRPVDGVFEIGLGLIDLIFEGPNQYDGGAEAGATEDVTVAEALREMIAHTSGNGSGSNGPTTVYKSRKGGRNRIVATQANGNRAITSRDKR